MNKQLTESLLAACKAAGIEKPKYIAQDKDGSVFHYNEMPITYPHHCQWYDTTSSHTHIDHPPYADDWTESLLEWIEQDDTTEDADNACEIAYRAHIEKGDGLCWSRPSDYRQGWQDALAWKGGAK